MTNLPPLRINQVLAWADDHLQRHDRWPMFKSGPIDAPDAHGIKWRQIDTALHSGRLGGRPGSSLAKLLLERRGKPLYFYRARLSNAEIARMADEHRRRTNHWPHKDSGPVLGVPGRTWGAINATLTRYGDEHGRKLSVPDLLFEAFGKRNPRRLPNLTVNQVLAWVDAHHRRTGVWPTRKKGGRVLDAPGETWPALDASLRAGRRGLPKAGGLAMFLDRCRDVRNKAAQPPLTYKQILRWADDHHQRTGDWPNAWMGPVHGVPNENWMSIDGALKFRRRGLRSHITLAKFLAKHRGKRDIRNPPRLSISQVLRWADAHYRHTGDWPSRQTGRVIEAPQEHWSAINDALSAGRRGLPGRSSLVRLLSERRRSLYHRRGVPLKYSQILEWAALHHELTGRLPTVRSGPVIDEPGERWDAIDAALRYGSRTLPGNGSLVQLLRRHYVPANKTVGRPLSVPQILRWADAFHHRVGYWPTIRSAYTDPSRRERWSVVDRALREGFRGLEAGSSLARLLATHRGVRSRRK